MGWGALTVKDAIEALESSVGGVVDVGKLTLEHRGRAEEAERERKTWRGVMHGNQITLGEEQ
jgi:primosomal replication protein N